MFLPLRVWCGSILGVVISCFFFFRRWLAAAARYPGVVACAAAFFLSYFRRWLAAVARHLGVVASRRGAGSERGKPLYTPYDPRTPLVRGVEGVSIACRIPCPPLAAGGQVGAHLPALRAICAPAAALPLHGDRLRAPARWIGGIFCGSCFGQRGAIFFSRNRLFGSVRRISKGKPYFRRAATAVPTGKDSTAKSFPA